jgi:hypothetical protein
MRRRPRPTKTKTPTKSPSLRISEPIPHMICCVCTVAGAVGREVVPLATREWVHRVGCWPRLIARRAAAREMGRAP